MAGNKNGQVELAIAAALVGNLIIAVLKLISAIQSESSGLLAEAAHSFADTGNQFILLVGARLALRPPDRTHPFGYGKDRYFWTFLAAVAMFTVGATFSVYQGIGALNNPSEVHHSTFNYVVLGVAAVLESVALTLALRTTWTELRRRGMWSAIRDTKDPTRYIVVFEDSAALVGIVIAVLGLALSQAFGVTVFDGIAAILIGLLLGAIALVLGYESRSLLLGESVNPMTRGRILDAVRKHREVDQVVELQTMHLGPEELLIGLELHFDDRLGTEEVEAVVRGIEESIKQSVPSARYIFIESTALP